MRRLSAWAAKHRVHVIADEMLTGMGRTGKMFACEHAEIEPDFLCLGKGLTSGWMAFSAVLTTNHIYDYFYDDYETNNAFLHSHTYSGNALAANVALAVLSVMQEEAMFERASQLGKLLFAAMCEVADHTNQLINIRTIGAMVAADLVTDDPNKRIGFEYVKNSGIWCTTGHWEIRCIGFPR